MIRYYFTLSQTRQHNFGELLPLGVPGELYIGGIQVARGYLKKPKLSSERFLPDTFNEKAGQSLYKTGDLARWLEDGNVEYLGRLDNQVKIRGFRIELEEVESVLRGCAGVIQCCVIIDETLEHKRLVAFVVLEKALYKNLLRKFLEAKLPEFMVPSIFIELQKIPSMNNGKVDRKALSRHEIKSMGTNFTAPANDLEQRIARIWMNVLNIKNVDVNDNFFQLGGHSLLAMRVIAAIKKELDIVLPVRALYHLNTVRLLAKSIELRDAGPPVFEDYEEVNI